MEVSSTGAFGNEHPLRQAITQFTRTIGIDYSGVATPTASLKCLRVYLAEGDAPPAEIPPPSPRKYWTRRGIAEWLVCFDRLSMRAFFQHTHAGIDHGFSFPLGYFEVHRLAPDWPAFLEDPRLREGKLPAALADRR